MLGAAVLAGCGLFGSGDAPGDVGELAAALDKCRAEPSPDDQAAVVVWLDVDAGPEQVAAVEDLLQSIPSVAEVDYIDRDRTWVEFEEYFADEPEIQELVEPEHLPTSFRITVGSYSMVDGVREAVEPVGSVDSIEVEPNPRCDDQVDDLRRACDAADPRRLRVWMDPGVAQPDVDAVDALLADSPVVDEARYVGPEETEAEAGAFFDEGTRELIDGDQLPTSFVVSLAAPEGGVDAASILDLTERLRSIPGVADIERDLLPDTERERMVCLEHWSLEIA
jgi:cell division protein FtsX